MLGMLAAISFGLAATGTAPEGAPTTAAAATRIGLFVFIYRPGPAWRQGQPMHRQALAPHAAYHRQLFEQGRTFAAGGFLDDGGMAIVRAADIDEARALLASDPAITSGVFVGTVEQWRPRFRSNEPLPQTK